MIIWKVVKCTDAYPHNNPNAKRSLLPTSLLVEVVRANSTEFTVIDLSTGVLFDVARGLFDNNFERIQL